MTTMNTMQKKFTMDLSKLPLDIEYMIYDFIPRPTEHIQELARARWYAEDKWSNDVWGNENKDFEKEQYKNYIQGYIRRIKLLNNQIMPYME